MNERERVSGLQIWEGDDGEFYVRVEAVAAFVARTNPNTTDALLQWVLGEDES